MDIWEMVTLLELKIHGVLGIKLDKAKTLFHVSGLRSVASISSIASVVQYGEDISALLALGNTGSGSR